MDKLLKELYEAEPISGIADLAKQTVKAAAGAVTGPAGALGAVAGKDLMAQLKKLAMPPGMTLDDKHLAYKNVLLPVATVELAKGALGDNMKEIWDGEETGEPKAFTSIAMGNKQKPYIVFQNDSGATIKGVKQVTIYDKSLDEPAKYPTATPAAVDALLAKEKGKL